MYTVNLYYVFLNVFCDFLFNPSQLLFPLDMDYIIWSDLAYDRRSLSFRTKGRAWYHSNRLDELIRLHPLDRHKMAPVRRDRRSKVKILENHHWAAQT